MYMSYKFEIEPTTTNSTSESSSMMDGGDSYTDNQPSLLGHLFTFNNEYKHDIFNILQYSFISLIPCVLLNKLIQYNIPDATTDKGSVEIIVEIIIQLVVLLTGLWFIDRFTTYFKPYSNTPYPKHSVLFFSLGLIIILISIQSKLGEKINILYDRTVTAINGGTSTNTQTHSKKNKQQQSIPDVQILGNSSNSNLQMDTTSISNLPVINQSLQSSPIQTQALYNQSQQIQQPYTNMSSGLGGNRGGGGGGQYDTPIFSDEPVPANGLMGGSFGTAW